MVYFLIERMASSYLLIHKMRLYRFILEIAMFKESAAILTAITALLAGILGILKYFQYRTRRDKIMLVRQAFDTVVNSLASNVEVERMAGAILLRRFFDRETEVGFEDETVLQSLPLHASARGVSATLHAFGSEFGV